MEFNLEQPLEAIELTEKEKIHIQRLASSRRRAAINYLDNFEDIHRHTLEALTMADEGRGNSERKGCFKPILSCGAKKINDDNFYKLLTNFTKADVYFTLNQRIFRNTLLANGGEFNNEEQLKEVDNNQEEMNRAARIMNNKIAESLKKNKKKEA